MIWLVAPVNPEPWTVGTISYKRISPSPNLVAYQSALREELAGVEMLPPEYRKITFYFFRQQAQYIDMRDKIRTRNQADATNMQKATEDALQGILFDNDREVMDIRSVIVQQGPHVLMPGVVICAEEFVVPELPDDVMLELVNRSNPRPSKNVWPPPGGITR